MQSEAAEYGWLLDTQVGSCCMTLGCLSATEGYYLSSTLTTKYLG
jgi:hypothetical protein